MQSDPIGLGGGLNTYGYVSANPLKFVDPLGLDQTIWDGLFSDNGRNRLDGPRNGNWGGKCWSGGQNSCKSDIGQSEPTDSADACYRSHDLCYVACNKKYGDWDDGKFCLPIVCHRQLKQCLRNLDEDCSKWPQPPLPGTEDDTIQFLNDALNWFGTDARPYDGWEYAPTPPEFEPYIGNDDVPPSDFL